MSRNEQQNTITPGEILKNLEKTSKILDKIIQETEENRQKMEKTDKQIEKVTQQMDRTDKRLDNLGGRFDDRWGLLVESLVEGKVVELLQSRGINIHETGSRIQGSYKDEKGELQRREIDIIAANGEEVVAVEVKTTLRPDDVKYFLETLKKFKKYFHRYKKETLYGAVAYLRSHSEAHLFAEKQGLFVIRATGDSASLINKKDFKPKIF